jgi:mono/diheme cytochrome c family protein
MCRLSSLVCLALAALAGSGCTLFAQSAPASGGVYTAEQAERGRRLYIRDCAECHGPTLAGAEGGSALAGPEFLARWEKKSVGELFELVRKTMPDSAPGSLSERQYFDLIAYLLRENAVPAGPAELARGEALATLVFSAR